MRYLCTLLFTLLSLQSTGQSPVVSRLILIGNAGEAVRENNHLLEAVKAHATLDAVTTVLYLGNNVRWAGDTAALRREADLIAGTPAKAWFIPGFKDWAKGGPDGYEALMQEERFLKRLDNKQIKSYPGDGCPGPKKVDLDADAEMIILDSQWWLHDHSKPDVESDCKYRTKDEVLTELEDLPKDKPDKLLLFVSHHPVKSTGIHSGTFGLKQHVFPFTDIRKMSRFYLPLPVIGSLYPIARNAIVTKQDLNNVTYQSLVADGIGTLPGIREAFEDHPFTIFLSGQEQNLQLLREGRHFFINSGAGGNGSRVRKSADALFVRDGTGFTVLEITEDKKVRVRFYLLKKDGVEQAYAADLLDYATLPPLAADTATMPLIEADHTTTQADPSLAHAGGIRRLLVGNNYRQEWGAPVEMKVLHLDREKGGMKITGMGGGHQSRSLQLEDASGTKWSFRTTSKNMEVLIPEGFRETVASDVVHDMLSSSHPYGAVVVPALEEPLGIVHPKPEVFFMPNDPALGIYRPLFANVPGQLEERKPARNDNGLISTTEMLNDMIKASDHSVDQKAYLDVRLVDFLIADFDRHQGQISWGYVDSAGRKIYYPVPKDRDQAFYNNDGLILGIARHGSFKMIPNFPYRIRNIRRMGIVGAYLDLAFMNDLTEADWRQGLSRFSSTLTEDVITSAVRQLPPEIYAIRGQEITDKLISRRNSVAEQGLGYYRFISRKVNVLGGSKDELFRVTGNEGGLSVQVYAREKDGSETLRYSRTFDPAVTRELRLYGFGGNDRFVVAPSAAGIRLRIVGGTGSDTFDIRGRLKNFIYDVTTEENPVIARHRTTKMFTRQPTANEYIFREPLHNAFGLPLLSFGYNVDDGVLLGARFSYRTFGFRQKPYASQQKLSALFALTNKAWQLQYEGTFNHVFRRLDLMVDAEAYNPVLRNFFGFGNESVFDRDKGVDYYRTRFNYLSLNALVRRRFLDDSIMSISVGPAAYYYWYRPEGNEARILEYPSLVGLDSAGVYGRKWYGGGRAVLTLKNINNDLLPVRGVDWTTEFIALNSLNDNAESYTRIQSTLDLYAELIERRRLLAAVHLGGGHIFSKHYEYFQALTLGAHSYLRGYRINRFAGSSMAYGSAELKLKLFDFNAYLVKGDFGLVGFGDVGRVWVQNDLSRKWHHSAGGGIYFTPFQTVMVSALAAASPEELLFNLTIGANLNMVFQGQGAGKR